MHSIRILLFVLLINWIQNGDATKTDYEMSPDVGNNNVSPKILLSSQNDRDLLRNKEIWNNIRNSVVKAWNFIKNLAKTTKQKLNTWTQNVKKRANDLNNQFKDHMKNIKEKIKDIIKKTFGNSAVIKTCLQKEKPEIENMINNIIKDVSTCMTNNTKKPVLLSINLLTVNDTTFFRNLEQSFQLCERDLDNAEECMYKVRQDNFNDMQDMETDILKTRTEARNVIDDLLGALVACSIEGLVEASTLITLEVVKITKCILKPQSI